MRDVKLYRDCLSIDNPAACQSAWGSSLTLIGSATFVPGARPDVEAAFRDMPQAYRAGWGMQVLSNVLPHVPLMRPHGGQGAITFYAVATDEDGHQTLLGRSTADHAPTSLAFDNDAIAMPFGTIDTPAEGAATEAILANFGWALTPDVDAAAGAGDILIPTDGSSVIVWIDGAPWGSVSYNLCRGNVGNPVPPGVYCNDDVANVFGNAAPQIPLTPRSSNPTVFRNLDAQRGAIGVFAIDTTTLPNGLHTIAWSVTDSAGRTNGVGSRFFVVRNGASLPAFRAAALDTAVRPSNPTPSNPGRALPIAHQTILMRTGFDLGEPYTPLLPDAAGIHRLTLPEMGRVELLLEHVDAGYLLANGQARDLPVGSRLDAGTATFTWSPPPGFIGAYRLVFTRPSGAIIVEVRVASRE